MITRIFFAALVSSALALPAFGQSQPAVRIMLGAPPGSPVAGGAEAFLGGIRRRLDGFAQIEVAPPGGNPLERVRSGEVDVAAVPSVQFAASRAPGLALYDLPFFFVDLNEVSQFQNSGIGTVLLAQVVEDGVVGLAYWNLGMSQLLGAGSLRIRGAEDLRGSKLRTTVSPTGLQAATQLGVSTVQIGPGDVAIAMERGTIDLAELPGSLIAQRTISLPSTGYAEVNYRPVMWILAANENFWNSTTFRIQTTLAEEARAAAAEMVGEARRQDAAVAGNLRERGFQTVAFSRFELLGFGGAAQAGWRDLGELQRSGLLDAALATRAHLRTPPTPPRRSDVPAERSAATILFATDRRAVDDPDPKMWFGGQRGDVRFGAAGLTPAADRRLGDAAATSIRLDTVDIVGAEQGFRTLIAEHLARASRREALIYVHGYNTTFQRAAQTAQQLKDDTKFPGVVALFSWPSDGAALNYPRDEQQVRTSRNAFVDFLRLMKASGVARVHVVAHSMGGRLVAEAFDWLHGQPANGRPRLHNLVLAAPDVDVTLFSQVAPAFMTMASRVSLYASDKDEALQCSRSLHRGSSNEARAGQGGSDILVLKGIDSIDVSPVESAPWVSWPCTSGHSYISQNVAVLGDLHQMLMFDAPPEVRQRLAPKTKDGTQYWVFR